MEEESVEESVREESVAEESVRLLCWCPRCLVTYRPLAVWSSRDWEDGLEEHRRTVRFSFLVRDSVCNRHHILPTICSDCTTSDQVQPPTPASLLFTSHPRGSFTLTSGRSQVQLN